LGISKDSLKSHHSFIDKNNLPFVLLSDPDKKAHKLYGVLNEKGGTIRSTFIIDESGKIVKEYRGVQVKGHIEAVIDFLEQL